MSGAYVFIDRSQFPERVHRDLIGSLRSRAINHKFHYDTYKQAAKWLAVHEAHSPARTDESCRKTYQRAFQEVAERINDSEVHLVGLGCGGGQKEEELARALRSQNIRVHATMSDVSVPLALTASERLRHLCGSCAAAVLDLATVENFPTALRLQENSAPRVVTLFGMLPNFEPEHLLGRVTAFLRAGDWLCLSANLAPGADYRAGVVQVLPQYDNTLTRDWLTTLLLDLGFEQGDGELSFSIETDTAGLHRITAHFELSRAREVRVFGEVIAFAAGERLRVFFSYRHTASRVTTLLRQHGLDLVQSWTNESNEEGVFLCRVA